MKNILLLILVCVGVVSCDGRKSHSESLQEAVEEFRDSVGPIEIIKYIPEDYAENVTDTILSNGFRVKIKTFTDMEHSYLNEFKTDTVTNKHYYRNYIADIVVLKDEKKVLVVTIDNDFIMKNDPSMDVSFKNEMTMHGIWIDQSKSDNHNNVVLDFSFCQPETDFCYDYQMIIEANGNYQIKEIEEHY